MLERVSRRVSLTGRYDARDDSVNLLNCLTKLEVRVLRRQPQLEDEPVDLIDDKTAFKGLSAIIPGFVL